MLIVWGRKIVRRDDGFGADFCPFCRRITPFTATELRRVSHIYFIPTDEGEAVAGELKCIACGVVRTCEPDTALTEPQADENLIEFAARTSPRGLDELQSRVELESRLETGEVSLDERLQLVSEPFLALHYFADVRRTRGADRYVTSFLNFFAIVGLAVSPIMVFMCLDRGRPSPEFVRWTVGIAALTMLLVLVSIYRIVTEKRRVMCSTSMLTLLAKALQPVKPTREELEQVCRLLRVRGGPVTAYVRASALSDAINRLS